MCLPGIRVDGNKFICRDSWGSKPKRRPEGEVGRSVVSVWFRKNTEYAAEGRPRMVARQCSLFGSLAMW